MNENIKKAFEAYIEGDVSKAFEQLIPGSEYHYFLTILDALKGKHDKKQIEKMIKEYGDRYGSSDYNRVKLRQMLLKYDTTNEKGRKDVIDFLQSNYIYASFGHTKPADLKRKEKKVEKEYNLADHTFQAKDHILTTEKFIQEFIEGHRVNEFHPHFWNQIDYSKLKEGQFQNLMNHLSDFAQIEHPSFLKEMKKYFDKRWKDYQYYTVEDYLVGKLTIEQLEQLGKLSSKVKNDHHYIGTLFKKKYHEKLDPERIEDLTHEERREELIVLYNASKSLPQSFRTTLLHEILENGVMLDLYDKSYFLEYMKNPVSTYCLNDKKHKSSYGDSTWNQYLSAIQKGSRGYVDYDPLSKLYEKYLEHFYRESGGNLKAFQDHFDKDWWTRTISKIEFLAGKDLKQLPTDTGLDYEQLAKSVEIELLQSNQPVFKKED